MSRQRDFSTGALFSVPEAAGECPPGVRENGRILVVAGERSTLDFVSAALQEAGFDVDMAGDGLEAIGRIESARYRALIIDLHLPRLDGLGVLRFLSERRPELLPHTAVITGLSLPEISALFPVCETLPKPVSRARLVEIVRRCVGVRQ